MGDDIRFELLGPFRVHTSGGETALAKRERVLLAMLLLYANQPVDAGRLIEAIWGETPPRDARSQLQSCVSRLRKQLARAGFPARAIVTDPAGYRIDVAESMLDLPRFQHRLAEARTAAEQGRSQIARDRYRAALAQWRGPALTGFDSGPVRRAAVTLDEEYAQAVEERIQTELALGAAGELVPELTDLIRQHPYRESLHGALMVALFRAGRQADALAAYQQVRALLVEHVGTEPGKELRELHQALLRGEFPAPQPPTPVAADGKPPEAAAVTAGTGSAASPWPAHHPHLVVPRQLPTDVPGFTGRADDLDQLDALLAGAEAATAVVITAIGGTAGVGKTALAVHWAHQVRDRFPDGQLYVNLRGFDPHAAPVEPTAAVGVFLDALRVPPQRIPPDLDAQVGLYRSLLAGRRMLVLLDNAHDAAQVRPLLPGTPGALVLVTSRHQLAGLVAAEGAVPLALDLLPDHEARQLLAARLGKDRLDAEPEAAAALLTACAGLPLALAIVAAHAATRPGLPLAALAAEVRRAGAGLGPWSGPDAATDLRAVFSWSYHALDPPAARLFRLLGLHPGPDLSAPAAASLASIPLPQTRRLLADLSDAHLLTEPAPGRHTFHDLLRAYATELTHTVDSDADRHAARHRLLDYYLHTAYAARTLSDPHRKPPHPPAPQPGVAPPDLPDQDHATTWVATELAVLLQIVEDAAGNGFHTHTWQLAHCIGHFLNRTGQQHHQLSVQRTALLAAQRLADRTAQATVLPGLGQAYAALGDHDQAREHLERALQLYSELGDQEGQAYAYLKLSWFAVQRHDHHEALRQNLRAHELYRSSCDRAGEAVALNNVSWLYATFGDYRQALPYCEQALAIHQEIGDTSEAPATWDSLGYIHHHLGDHQQAITCFQQALALLDRHDNAYGRTQTLTHLGDALDATGQTDAAREAWQAALDILQDIDHPDADQVRAKLRDHAMCG